MFRIKTEHMSEGVPYLIVTKNRYRIAFYLAQAAHVSFVTLLYGIALPIIPVSKLNSYVPF